MKRCTETGCDLILFSSLPLYEIQLFPCFLIKSALQPVHIQATQHTHCWNRLDIKILFTAAFESCPYMYQLVQSSTEILWSEVNMLHPARIIT